MADPIDIPIPAQRLVDDKGQPTRELLEFLQQIKDALDDHETRIVALEP